MQRSREAKKNENRFTKVLKYALEKSKNFHKLRQLYYLFLLDYAYTSTYISKMYVGLAF